MVQDIIWHEEEPETKGIILAYYGNQESPEDRLYLDIFYWHDFQDLQHSQGWYDSMGDYICGKIFKYARIK